MTHNILAFREIVIFPVHFCTIVITIGVAIRVAALDLFLFYLLSIAMLAHYWHAGHSL